MTDSHYLRIRWFISPSHFAVEKCCRWVDDHQVLATFVDYDDALEYAQTKADEKGLEVVDETGMKKKKKKKKKGGD